MELFLLKTLYFYSSVGKSLVGEDEGIHKSVQGTTHHPISAPSLRRLEVISAAGFVDHREETLEKLLT